MTCAANLICNHPPSPACLFFTNNPLIHTLQIMEAVCEEEGVTNTPSDGGCVLIVVPFDVDAASGTAHEEWNLDVATIQRNVAALFGPVPCKRPEWCACGGRAGYTSLVEPFMADTYDRWADHFQEMIKLNVLLSYAVLSTENLHKITTAFRGLLPNVMALYKQSGLHVQKGSIFAVGRPGRMICVDKGFEHRALETMHAVICAWTVQSRYEVYPGDWEYTAEKRLEDMPVIRMLIRDVVVGVRGVVFDPKPGKDGNFQRSACLQQLNQFLLAVMDMYKAQVWMPCLAEEILGCLMEVVLDTDTVDEVRELMPAAVEACQAVFRHVGKVVLRQPDLRATSAKACAYRLRDVLLDHAFILLWNIQVRLNGQVAHLRTRDLIHPFSLAKIGPFAFLEVMDALKEATVDYARRVFPEHTPVDVLDSILGRVYEGAIPTRDIERLVFPVPGDRT